MAAYSNPFKTPAIEVLLKTPVRWKRNTTRPLNVREAITRIVSVKKVPEVMVKVKRAGSSSDHVKAHLDYITRNGKLDGETERGELVQGKAHLQEILKEWSMDEESVRPNSRNTINAIFSMPPGTNPERVKKAVREFAKQELAQYQYLFVLHTDDEHPHCHLSIRTLGLDGKKLNPRKEDLQVWREVFAEKLREQGIEAQATYRPVRGIIEKRLSMAQYKAKHDRKDERSQRTYEERVKAAVRSNTKEPAEWVSNKPKKKDPWGEQLNVRKSWRALEKNLRKTGLEADKALADDIVKFVLAMPAPQTQHQRLAKQLLVMRHQAQVAQAPQDSDLNKDRPTTPDKGRER
jgi:type IV secretion system T-DNA border endonuclease VirD2